MDMSSLNIDSHNCSLLEGSTVDIYFGKDGNTLSIKITIDYDRVITYENAYEFVNSATYRLFNRQFNSHLTNILEKDHQLG